MRSENHQSDAAIGKVDSTFKLSRVAQTKMATVESDDERLLNEIGYTQEFNRHFTKWSTLSYAVSVLGVLGSVPPLFGTSLSLGGPAASVWAWFIGSIMASCISNSVAELVSAYPTAGGMYFVTKNVVPAEHVAAWSWIMGWCNLLGQTAGVASVNYTVSQMILAAASMNSTFDAETATYAYSPTPLHIVLLSISVLLINGVICSLATKSIHRIVLWFAPINVLATISICVTLLVLTTEKQDARFVFTELYNGSGWGTGFSFLMAFLPVAWTMTDYDGTTHLSEETKSAALIGAFSIRHAVTISGVLGFMLNVTFCFCIRDLDSVLQSPTGLPAAQIFLDSAGRLGGTVMWAFAILVQVFTGCSAMLADTRMAYAFSRDGALPFSSIFSRVNDRTQTPVNAVWLVVFFACALNLIGIGSTATIVAIFNITAPALDISYASVILARIIYANKVEFKPGPFTLGIWQMPLNLVAVTWVTFISIVLLFPTKRPVTPTNMNYAIVVGGIIALFAMGWWWVGAKDTYTGPKTKEDSGLGSGVEAGDEEALDHEGIGEAHMVADQL